MAKKNYIFIVMMNMDPMGGYADWRPFRAFKTRKEARAFLNTEWKRTWGGYKKEDIPIDKDWLFDIERVVLG